MKGSGLIVAAVILAGLVGALYWSNHHKPAETTEAAADAPPKILAVKTPEISKFDLKKDGTEQVGAERNAAGQWQITSPAALPADQSAVSSLLGTFSSLNSQRLVEEKASNLAPYGLDAPKFEVDLTEKNNQTQSLLLGDATPASNAIYAKLGGDPRIFTIPSYDKTSIDKSANDLRDKRLLTVNPDKISEVDLVANKQEMAFGRNKDEWQIVKPKPLRADAAQVDSLVRALTDAKMELTATDDRKKTAFAFASATPVATAKVTAESGTQELQVRKNKENYYAKSSAVEGIYKIPNTLGQALDKNLEDFRNRKLFDLGSGDPNKIEVRDGLKTYFLTRSGEDWWSGNAKKMDAGTVQDLIDKVRELSASKFVDSGFTAPMIDLTVTSGDGKRMEKVSISKAGDNYIAIRENEPATLYQLDSKTVEDLTKSAAEVKPATAAASGHS
ncbi:MAG TPA: DUF4340 domain-containing protein [Terriglobales bacterium]|jgi:hypothetical protein|nr:DUF4340 domain-containing protein [Terriglobales bacterium]